MTQTLKRDEGAKAPLAKIRDFYLRKLFTWNAGICGIVNLVTDIVTISTTNIHPIQVFNHNNLYLTNFN